MGRFYHVQFFGDNGSRSWIASNLLFPFQGGVEELMKDEGFMKHVSIRQKMCLYSKLSVLIDVYCMYIFRLIPRAKFSNLSSKFSRVGDRIGNWLLMRLKKASRKQSIYLIVMVINCNQI